MSFPLDRPPATEAGPELLVQQKWETFTAWFLNHTARWPKAARFTLTQRLENHALDVTERSIQSWRKKAVLEGPDSVLVRKPRVTPPVPPKVDGRIEAHITKLACSTPPDGRNRWTLRLLAVKVVELEIVDSLSHETVRQALKKTA